MPKQFKILFLVNVDWFFLSHRLPIAITAKEKGYHVTIVAADTGDGEKIRKQGLDFVSLSALAQKAGMLSEFRLIRKLSDLYQHIKPDLVHHVTIRPVLYGSIAARRAGIPAVINALSGLGYLYINHTPINRAARKPISHLFRYGFRHPNSRLILQNQDDEELILSNRLIQKEKIEIIRGSGVDIDKFSFTPETQKPDPCHIVYTGRMLWDKGIGELVEAIKKLHEKGHSILLHLYGAPYEANPKSISAEQLENWDREPFITYHGFQENMAEALQKANIVCLPSYREGLPKTLLEAAATGRAIVTTDVPGCREVVDEGVNGYLVPAKNVEILADRLEKLINNPEQREAFGKAGRKKAVAEFSEKMVVKKTLALYEELLK